MHCVVREITSSGIVMGAGATCTGLPIVKLSLLRDTSPSKSGTSEMAVANHDDVGAPGSCGAGLGGRVILCHGRAKDVTGRYR